MSQDRVLVQINAWREDLINLNRNNRLLYFRKTKSSTLEVLRPVASELLSCLSNVGKGITFWEPPDDSDPETRTDCRSEGDATSPTLFEPIERGAPEHRTAQRQPRKKRADTPSDCEIVCDVASRELLHKTLRWLERRTSQEFMDKGLWVLYLGVGMLDWIEAPQGTGESEKVSSPIILIPVALSRNGAKKSYQLHRADEDAALNPALAFKLQHDFGITLPSFDDEDEEQIDSILNSVRRAIAEQEDWNVRDAVVLSVFSFHKEVMYRDLLNNEAAVAAHPIVQTLALGHRTNSRLSFEPIPENDLDDQHPPESMITILDCDASQRQCLVAASLGHSFVMEGPPGTGKSQTIANMIAHAMERDKTVLFVSEKAAALEVVYSRLETSGLAEFVLELHSHKATRKQVAQTLGRSLTTRLATRNRFPDVDLQRLLSYRRELTEYARAMNERRELLGKSVHEVIGELSAFQHLPQAPACNSIDTTLTAAALAKIYEAAGSLGRAWEPVQRGDEFLWRSLVDSTLTQARRASLLATLDRALRVIGELDDGTKLLADETGLPWLSSIADTRRFESLVALLGSRRQIPSPWLTVQPLEPIRARLETLAISSQELKRLITWLSANAGTSWRELDGPDLHSLEQSRCSLAKSAFGHLTTELSGWRAATALSGCLREAAVLLQRGSEAAVGLCNALEAPTPRTVPELSVLIELSSFVFSPEKPAALWLDPVKLPEVRKAIDVLEPRVNGVKSSLAAVEMLFNSAILAIDVEGLQLRFGQIHHGLGKLRPAYWRDKRCVRDHAKSGRVRVDEINGLHNVVECKRRQRDLIDAESRLAALIGSDHYRSLKSDFRSIRSALAVADTVLRLAGGKIGQEALSRRFSIHADQASDIVRVLSEMQQWPEQFAVVSKRLGPSFDKLVVEQPLSALVDECAAAAADIDQIGQVLSRVAQIAEVEEVSLDSAIERLNARAQVEEIESQLAKDESYDRELLGPSYTVYETDFQQLAEDLDWAAKIRDLTGEPLSNEVADRILGLDVTQHKSIASSRAEWSQLEATILNQFDEAHRPEIAAEFETPFCELKSLLDALVASIDDISEWGAYSAAVSVLSDHGLAPAVTFCVQQHVTTNHVSVVLRRSALESWVDSVRASDPRLRKFLSNERDYIAQAFKELDRRFIELAAAQVIATCNAKRPRVGAGAAGLIAAEANKQKRHMPIRRLIEEAGSVVQALKPCLMMSPLSVSQFLPPTMCFDLVIFDEASQVKPADAINCTYRGRQLVIAGDQKQLPPTPFFDKLDSDIGDEWEEEQLQDYESVLDVAKGAGALRSLSLRWHYRSQHEDLITYSNYSFYEGQLVTFPSANIQGSDVGVELFVVPGVYRRGGPRDNPIEAAEVVERVLFHVRQHPHLSIGVVAFSEAQASTIENEILRRREEHPELRVMLDGDRLHGGFVKNLESVQGDERDIIIFSIGYGRDEAGRFTLNFGPLNKIGGHRRLNVAITRARRRVEVVSSIAASDFVGELRSEGVRHLRRYLEFAARSDNRLAALSVDLGPDGRDCESPFEEEVARVIRSWGHEVIPQVGCADYRIDLAVKHPEYPGRYALGIECDGAMYHSSRVARDRDRLRQEVLTRLGWANLHRIWGLSWYWNRGQEEIRLRRAIEQAVNGPRNAPPTPPRGFTEPEKVNIELNDAPEWVIPYKVVTPGPPQTSAAMHEGTAQGDLQRMIMEVVRGEGPVAKEVVLRRVRERWGMNRAGNRAREAFDTAIRTLRRKGEVEFQSDDFLTVPNQVTRVRAGNSAVPETTRTIREIPPSELKEAIVRFVREVHSITEDELTARIAAVFGWNRRGSDIATAFRSVVKRLVTAGFLNRSGENLTAAPDTERT